MADQVQELETLTFQAKPKIAREAGGVRSGLEIDKAIQIYDELYAQGTLSNIHFGVELTPFDTNGELANSEIKLFDSLDLANYIKNKEKFNREQISSSGNIVAYDSYNEMIDASNEPSVPSDFFTALPLVSDDFVLPWLAQTIDLSVMDAQSESVKTGSFQLNFITGNASNEISIPFIETRNGAILNSALEIKKIMFPDDGTQALPKDYLMYLKIFVYDKHIRSVRIIEVQHLVALQASNLPLEATNINGVSIVTLNFLKMFPML